MNFYEVESGKPKMEKAIASISIPADSTGWSARILSVEPRISLRKGKQYLVILSSATTQGCYGFAIGQPQDNTADLTEISDDSGKNFKVQINQQLKYSFSIK